jgi:UMF1 family MFS transporter
MGVQTVMLMAVQFAKKEIKGLEDSNLIVSVLLIQFVGILGSFLFSRLSKKIGNIKGLGVSLFIWIGICVGTYQFVYTPNTFYVVACSVGLVMGGVQSLSRSTYSKLLPETEDNASYFSFFDVCEKIGIVIGMLSFGAIEQATGGMRNSLLALITFFVVGFLVLLTIPKTKNVQ